MDAEEQLQRLRLYFLRKQPFFYFLLRNLEVRYHETSSDILTVSDYGLSFSQRFLELDPEQKLRLVRHAIYHIIQSFPLRARKYRGSSQSFLAASNIKAIYDLEQQSGLYQMVLNFLRRLELHDTVGKMAVEELAQRLEHGDEVSQVNVVIKNYSEKLDGQVLQSSSFSKSEEQNETPAGGREVEKSDADMGGHLGEPVLDETALESWVKTLMARAVVFSKMAGISDPLTERLLEEILTTRVPWATLLKRALEEGVGSRILQTYQKPHRRLSDLPGVKRHTKRVVVCVDVSGSISDEEYARFVSIIQSLSHSCEIIFIAWDTVATNLGKVKTRSELEKVARRAKGYGGTQPNCLVPLLKKLRPHLTVILTDGRWGAWSDLAHWSRGRRVIVATTDYVDPAWRFWRIIRVGKE